MQSRRTSCVWFAMKIWFEWKIWFWIFLALVLKMLTCAFDAQGSVCSTVRVFALSASTWFSRRLSGSVPNFNKGSRSFIGHVLGSGSISDQKIRYISLIWIRKGRTSVPQRVSRQIRATFIERLNGKLKLVWFPTFGCSSGAVHLISPSGPKGLNGPKLFFNARIEAFFL